MRKMFLTLVFLIAFFPACLHAAMPVVSPATGNPNADSEGNVWYYILTDVLDVVTYEVDADDRLTTGFPAPDKEAQLWKITAASDGYYYLVNKKSGALRLWTHAIVTDMHEFYAGTNAIEGLATDPEPFEIRDTNDAMLIYRIGAIQPLARGGDPRYNAPNTTPIRENSTAGVGSVHFILPKDLSFYPALLLSTAENPVWHYIQFPNTGKVIQDNGPEVRLSVEAKLDEANENADAQLWRITYDNETSEASTLFYGTYSIVNKKSGHKIFYENYPATNGIAPVDEVGFYALPDNTVARYDSATRICDVTLSATLKVPESSGNGYLIHGNWNNSGAYLQHFMIPGADDKLNRTNNSDEIGEWSVIAFIPAENSNVGIQPVAASKIRIFPNPAKEFISVELPENATSIIFINAMGQTVKKVKPSVTGEPINISAFAPGIYFMKIEKPSGAETVKLIKN
ncbi:MAG: T9SS type A sorting domain-containing protein [Candidatus Symbiothrix sp.]|jgi:hypothetical protein|nr:T9SS type A sorting domain-containing protein [Candidatus Symbiothrix sp.]